MTCCINDEVPQVHSEDFRRARKEYKCCECGYKIKKGEAYQRIKQLFDGHWFDYKTCEKCADLRDSLASVDCPYMEGLAECFTFWLTDGPDTIMAVNPDTHAARLVPDYIKRKNPAPRGAGS